MKISIDDQELLTLNEHHIKVILDLTTDDNLEEDIKTRVYHIIMNRYEYCMKNLWHDWFGKLKDRGIAMIPTSDEEFAKLVFSQPDYKNCSEKNKLSQRGVDINNSVN